MDIDMLGITSNKEAEIIRQIQDILIVDVEPDGLDFDPDSIQCDRITEDANYEGVPWSVKSMNRPWKPPSQTWRTFLKNHMKNTYAIDFFTVPTANFKLFVVIACSSLAHKISIG